MKFPTFDLIPDPNSDSSILLGIVMYSCIIALVIPLGTSFVCWDWSSADFRLSILILFLLSLYGFINPKYKGKS